jgi:hypothetical protein
VPNKKLPKEVIDHWPEVFEDVDVDVIPIEYLYSIRITFSDGITWDVDLDKDTIEEDLEKSIDRKSQERHLKKNPHLHEKT